MVEISEIFCTFSRTSAHQDPMVTCVQKCLLKKIGTCIRNDSFEEFLVKT